MEIWENIKNYEDYYQVSNLGNIRSVDRVIETPNGNRRLKGKNMKKCPTKEGYNIVSLTKNNKSEVFYVGTLVVQTFSKLHDTKDRTIVIIRKNKIRTDDFIENLVVDTQRNSIKRNPKNSNVRLNEYSKFQASITIKGIINRVHLGTFKTEKEAVMAYNQAVIDLKLYIKCTNCNGTKKAINHNKVLSYCKCCKGKGFNKD